MPASTKTTKKKTNKKAPAKTRATAKKAAVKKPVKPRKPAVKPSAARAGGAVKSGGAGKAAAAPFPEVTNYQSARAWLFAHADHEHMRVVRYNERTFGLNRMRALLDKLGNPHEQLKAVHVAGTKGKGSTCAMAASMLRACGYTTGLYTSPHLIDLRERITIDGHMISYHDVTEVFQNIAEAESQLKFDLTFFEIMTAAAFLHFAEQAVDVVVLETGLGGRLDCTNVCTPLVTAITGISLDHTNILGETVELIAREKAGIFKPGVPAISVAQEPAVAEVLREVAEEVGTTLEFTGKDIDFSYRFEANRELGPHSRVCLTTPQSRFEHLPVPLRGEHQAHNCGLSLAILDKLKGSGFPIAEDHAITGLAATDLPGRMEEVWTAPRVLIDGAHNGTSLQALIKSLGAHVSYDSLVLVFGCGQDKDVTGMLKQVSLGADKVIFTQAKGNPRAVEPRSLISRFADLSGKMAQTAANLPEALGLAARAVSREDLIVVTGSFYLAGEARDYFQKLPARRNKAAK